MREVYVSSTGFKKPRLSPGEEFILVISTPDGGLKKILPTDESWSEFCKTYGIDENGRNRDVPLRPLDGETDIVLMMEFRGGYWTQWEEFCEDQGYESIVTD